MPTFAIKESSVPGNLPDAAGFARQDHVVAKVARVVERNPGVVRLAA